MVTSHSMIREDAFKTYPDIASNPCHLVIDSGFSFTYGVPFFGGVPMKQCSMRIDVGGKLLTNYLCEIIS